MEIWTESAMRQYGSIEMDRGTLHDTTVSMVDGDPGGDIKEIPNDNREIEGGSYNKEVIGEIARALIRIELGLACTSEKLVNMNLFMMHVAARESDFEAFASGKEDPLDDSAVKALEFYILSGFFDLEVTEMDKFIRLLQREVINASEMISAHKHPREAFMVMEEKLRDAEESIKQSLELVSELMMQSARFRRILSKFNGEETSIEEKEVAILEGGDSFSTSTNFKMETSEQQRHILRMLEKSLARELDLETKLTECTQALNEMKLRLCSSELEFLSMEAEAAAIYARYLEADNASTVLMSTSKELTGQLQLCELTVDCARQRESDLNVRLQNCMQSVERLEKEEGNLEELAQANHLEALVNFLEEQLKASESLLLSQNASLDSNNEKLKELEEKVVIAEIRAEKAEDECRLLAETNKGLTEELDHLKGSCVPREKVESLEKQLMETNIQLQQAMAYVDASQEQQSMLHTSINDMNSVIENLKSKVSKADARADSVEEKCIILSENNAELNEELTFLRAKLECLEASFQRAEETKLATAKDIDIRTQMITGLIMQLAIERERLQKQMSFLMKENRALVEKLRVANEAASSIMKSESEKNEIPSSECDVDSINRGDNRVSDTVEVAKLPTAKEILDTECQPELQDVKSKLETVRTIDPGRLGINYVLTAFLTALIAVIAACFFSPESCPF
ncbi:hypothetical protein Cgig2_034037 [Carnegiea gigantea]|uniref:WIT1/2 N-terminal helical bundle domain-containing protein n=1 Tax=Carnegiea gigantea TaxID=171969 RepID=A0A9Q1GVA5_9CARY|nr:hypothetical protein Cgig2_034037 [Carnegiea gigantea]